MTCWEFQPDLSILTKLGKTKTEVQTLRNGVQSHVKTWMLINHSLPYWNKLRTNNRLIMSKSFFTKIIKLFAIPNWGNYGKTIFLNHTNWQCRVRGLTRWSSFLISSRFHGCQRWIQSWPDCRLAPNGTNPGLFQIIFQCILAHHRDMIWKGSGFVPFGVNLLLFGLKSDMPHFTTPSCRSKEHSGILT